MERRQLGRTGLQVSVIGFGASPLGDEFGSIDAAEGERAVQAAVDAGINLFDTSPFYGRTLSEQRLGAALRGRRERVVLATKCGRYGKAEFDFSRERVIASVEESLRRLQTDYLDLFTAHDIEFGDREQVVHETIPAMRHLQRQGKVRWVGISGLPLRLLADVAVRADVDYVLSYCHYNLMIRDLDTVLAPTLRERGMGLINASPLHMRMLTRQGAPEWHPAPEVVRQTAAAVVKRCEESGADPAMVALRFCLEYTGAASTLVGMVSVSELERNLKAMDYKIPAELPSEIENLVAPVRGMTWRSGQPENSDV